jgi:CheY-like chemotaxis protein
MDPAVTGSYGGRIANMKAPAIDEKIVEVVHSKVTELYKPDATVLVATNEVEIHRDMSELLESFPVKTVWARGMEEVKKTLSREKVSLCLCGFWLLDGTYRDVVRFLRLRRAEIPAIIVCAPSCPNDHRDYLAALNISAFDFICHPYRMSDMEKILHSAAGVPLRPPSPVSPLVVPGAAGLQKAS